MRSSRERRGSSLDIRRRASSFMFLFVILSHTDGSIRQAAHLQRMYPITWDYLSSSISDTDSVPPASEHIPSHLP